MSDQRIIARCAWRLIPLMLAGVLAGCAMPYDGPDYETPASTGASVQPALLEGTFRRGGRRAVCAYAVMIDGQRVKPEGDCTVGVAIRPGPHTVVAWIDG